jgi:hypothetical protein
MAEIVYKSSSFVFSGGHIIPALCQVDCRFLYRSSEIFRTQDDMMTKAYSLTFKNKMVERLTGSNATDCPDLGGKQPRRPSSACSNQRMPATPHREVHRRTTSWRTQGGALGVLG